MRGESQAGREGGREGEEGRKDRWRDREIGRRNVLILKSIPELLFNFYHIQKCQIRIITSFIVYTK